MKKIFIGLGLAGGLILQGFFAAPALAQNYSGYAYPSSYFPQYQYPQYQYPSYSYQYPNYNYQYGNQYCYGGYNYTCYPPQNYQNYGYPPSITGVSGPTQLTLGQTGTWQVQVQTNYPYGYSYNSYNSYLSYSVSWGDEGVNPYASAYNGAVTTGTLSHTYTQPGTYTARFTVTNQWGQSTSASVTVYVSAGCGYQYPYQYAYPYNPYGSNCYQYSQYPYVY